jgi:hypothetical protein
LNRKDDSYGKRRNRKQGQRSHECAQLLQRAEKGSQTYLDAAGTADEEKAAALLKKELKEDVNSIDHVIPFFESKEGAAFFGADTARNLAKAAHEAKDKGVKYCICPACTAGGWLLDHESEW